MRVDSTRESKLLQASPQSRPRKRPTGRGINIIPVTPNRSESVRDDRIAVGEPTLSPYNQNPAVILSLRDLSQRVFGGAAARCTRSLLCDCRKRIWCGNQLESCA
jgi:hypothetical protein